MSDYIKREDAIDALYEECNKDQSLSCPYQFFDGIASIPVADVRENVHGEWIDDLVAFHHVCSICRCCVRATMMEVFEGEGEWNYCPNCGAQNGVRK